MCWRVPRRRLPAAGLGLAVAGLLLHSVWLAPSFAAAPAPTGDPVRVMTLNLQFGRADTGSVAALLHRVRPDVVVLEETTPEALARLEARGVGDPGGGWGHRGGSPGPGASGTVVLSRFRVVEDGRFALGNGGARLRVLAPTPFTLTAVHTVYPLIGVRGWERDFRTLVADARATRGPHLVVGDFNATLDHAPMRDLLEAGLTDAAER